MRPRVAAMTSSTATRAMPPVSVRSSSVSDPAPGVVYPAVLDATGLAPTKNSRKSGVAADRVAGSWAESVAPLPSSVIAVAIAGSASGPYQLSSAASLPSGAVNVYVHPAASASVAGTGAASSAPAAPTPRPGRRSPPA